MTKYDGDEQEEKYDQTKDIDHLAEQHAEWYSVHFKRIVKTVYKDAFVHGAKHQEDINQ